MVDTGNGLLSLCESETIGDIAMCLGFIGGTSKGAQIISSLNKSPFICVPPSVTFGQQRDVVTKYLRDNPSSRHEPAASLILVALYDAFKCVSKK